MAQALSQDISFKHFKNILWFEHFGAALYRASPSFNHILFLAEPAGWCCDWCHSTSARRPRLNSPWQPKSTLLRCPSARLGIPFSCREMQLCSWIRWLSDWQNAALASISEGPLSLGEKGWPMKYSASFVKSSFTPVYLINNAMKDKIVFPIIFPSHIILCCCLMGIKMLKSLTQTRLSRSYLIKKQGSFSLRILLCQDDMMSARQKPDPADKWRKG